VLAGVGLAAAVVWQPVQDLALGDAPLAGAAGHAILLRDGTIFGFAAA
jgi:hypothetical protein